MKKTGFVAVLALAAMTALPSAVSAQDGDAAAGESTFNFRCTSCHNADEGGSNGIGPALFGVFGAPVGSRNIGYGFSTALADSGKTWDADSLDAWLKSPWGFIPGIKMNFAGMNSEAERQNVIAFLKSRS